MRITVLVTSAFVAGSAVNAWYYLAYVTYELIATLVFGLRKLPGAMVVCTLWLLAIVWAGFAIFVIGFVLIALWAMSPNLAKRTWNRLDRNEGDST